MKITVFCSSQYVDEKYLKDAHEFAQLMVKHGYDLVWGGSNEGIMKLVADEVQNGGGKIYGVSIDTFHKLARENADEMLITKSLGERKITMLEKGDAIAILVGGIGTLDEMSEVIELKRTHNHNKPIVILNTDNFYEGLRMQFKRMLDEGFLKSNLGFSIDDDLVFFANTPEEAIEHINKKFNK